MCTIDRCSIMHLQIFLHISNLMEMDYQKQIGKAIARLRALRGISQEKLSLEANIDRRYMSDIENGKRNVSLEMLCKLADYFGLTLSEFIARAERPDGYNESNDSLKEWAVDQGYEDAIVLESPTYRNAVLGISDDGRVIYSESIILEDMMIDEGMDEEEALDYFGYNLIRSLPYMGKMAPIILRDIQI